MHRGTFPLHSTQNALQSNPKPPEKMGMFFSGGFSTEFSHLLPAKIYLARRHTFCRRKMVIKKLHKTIKYR